MVLGVHPRRWDWLTIAAVAAGVALASASTAVILHDERTAASSFEAPAEPQDMLDMLPFGSTAAQGDKALFRAGGQHLGPAFLGAPDFVAVMNANGGSITAEWVRQSGPASTDEGGDSQDGSADAERGGADSDDGPAESERGATRSDDRPAKPEHPGESEGGQPESVPTPTSNPTPTALPTPGGGGPRSGKGND